MYLELKNIEKSYKYDKKEQKVLHGINLSFKNGEFVSILGESGCGKSTLMNIIGGMDSDYTGEVIFDGKNLKTINLDNYRKLEIGFVFQNFNLIPHLSILDNVMIALDMTSNKDKYKKAVELLTRVGLENHLNKRPNQLSGGQKQRVAIARSLANNPDVILADEPTGSLDQNTAEEIINILKEIALDGKLVIMVTHSERTASHGTRIIKISDGKIIEDQNIAIPNEGKEKEVNLKPKNLSFLRSVGIALQNMRLNLKRNILVSIGSSIGILSVVLMFSIGDGIKQYINNQIEKFADPLLIQVTKTDPERENVGPLQNGLGFNKEDIEKIKDIDNINNIEETVSYNLSSNLVLNDKNSNIMFLTSSYEGTFILTEENNVDLPKDNEIIMSDSLAKALMVEDNYQDIISREVTLFIREVDASNKPLFIEKKLVVRDIFKIEDDSSFLTAAVNYNTLEELYKSNNLELKPTMLNVYAKDINNVEQIKDDLEEKGFSDSTVAEFLETFTEYLNIATLILAGIAGISLIVSGIMILVVLYISVVERTKEIGILRAVGARRKDIRRIFINEASILGLSSGIIGVLGAVLIAFLLNNYIEGLYDVRIINVNPTFIFLGILVSIIVSLVASLIPSSKASKLDPMESLRYE